MTAWIWNVGESRFEPTDVTGSLLVADSWFVDNGKSLSLDPNRERFTRSACELGLPAPETDDFWNQLVDLVPSEGEWFPRIEFVVPGEAVSGEKDAEALSLDVSTGRFGSDSTAPALVFRLRPAPPRTREMKLWIPPFSDPRTSPRIKGPDIPLLGELRNEAIEQHGCDDVLLYDADGHVLETGTSSIVWWDGEVLCAPDSGLPILPGTTSARVLDEARDQGIRVDHRLITVDDLLTREVWTTNALHGKRRVSAWCDTRCRTGLSETS